MNTKDFETTCGVGDANIDFSIEASEATQGGVDRVGSVSGGHDNDIRAGLETVHESEELGDDTAFDFAIRLMRVC